MLDKYRQKKLNNNSLPGMDVIPAIPSEVFKCDREKMTDLLYVAIIYSSIPNQTCLMTFVEG